MTAAGTSAAARPRIPAAVWAATHMKTILRNSLAVMVGLVLGGIVNMALVVAGPQIIPPPAGIDMSDAKSLAAGVRLLEPKHFLFPFLAHAIGTLAGALTTGLIALSRRSTLSYAIGVLFLAGGISAAFLIPAPAWFISLDLLMAYLPMAWLGLRLSLRLRPAAH
jgi:hypothetical protein